MEDGHRGFIVVVMEISRVCQVTRHQLMGSVIFWMVSDTFQLTQVGGRGCGAVGQPTLLYNKTRDRGRGLHAIRGLTENHDPSSPLAGR